MICSMVEPGIEVRGSLYYMRSEAPARFHVVEPLREINIDQLLTDPLRDILVRLERLADQPASGGGDWGKTESHASFTRK